MSIHKIKNFRSNTYHVTFVLLLLLPGILNAQMFSVEEPERRTRVSSSIITAGPEFLTMSLREGEPFTGRVYNFSEPVYRIRLELPSIEVYGGFRSGMGDADSLNYLNLGANISGSLPLTRSREFGIMLPLWLSTDYTNVSERGSQQPESEQFRLSSASIGLGAGAFLNPMRKIRLRAEFVPQIGFTMSSMGSDSGQLATLNGRVRLQADQLFGRFGLVLAYNYTWKRYSGAGDRFDYDLSGHNLGIGVSF
jgi:hypothetical protein